MKINVCLIKAFQFLYQFCLVISHKFGKKHIIPDIQSRLASANFIGYNQINSKPDALFTYHTILVEISLDLIKHIFDIYLADNWWVKIRKQLLTNNNLGPNKAILPFIFGFSKFSLSTDPYYMPRFKLQDHVSDLFALKYAFNLPGLELVWLIYIRDTKLISYLDCVTGVHQLYILLAVSLNLLAITYNEGDPGFAYCHKIISHLQYIWGLIMALRAFIYQCPQFLPYKPNDMLFTAPYSLSTHLQYLFSHLCLISYSFFSLPQTDIMS